MPASADTIKAFHSMVRWNKPPSSVEAAGKKDKLFNSVDSANGNQPLHIAAQNGHRNLVQMLIKNKANVNAQNGTGTTALAMALQYDYWYSAKMLIDAGADVSIKNNEGHAAGTGIEGDKTIDNYVHALADAASTKELEFAMAQLEVQSGSALGIDKVELVQTGMGKKRSDEGKAMWTKGPGSVQESFAALCKKI